MRSKQQNSSWTFSTLLIRRKANERPTEWEIGLRPICHKIRIVEKLNGGAHLMAAGSPCVAVRIYSIDDIQRLENSMAEEKNVANVKDGISDGRESAGSGKSDNVESAAESGDGGDGSDGIDGLRNFRDSYKHSIVIFVLPPGQHQRDQLGRRESFVNSAQRSLLWRKKKEESEAEDGNKKRITRTFIATDVQQAINSIASTIQSLAPEKREKKRKYFTQLASQNYLPTTSNDDNGASTTIPPTKESSANHVAKTFHAWATRFEMPQGDASVVLSVLGTLGKVATASEATLEEVPIRNASKEMIARFFGSYSGSAGTNAEAQNDRLGIGGTQPIPDPVTNPFGKFDLKLSEITLPNENSHDSAGQSKKANIAPFHATTNGNNTNPYKSKVNSRRASNIPQRSQAAIESSLDPVIGQQFTQNSSYQRQQHLPVNTMDFTPIMPPLPSTRKSNIPVPLNNGYGYDTNQTHSQQNYQNYLESNVPPPSRSGLIPIRTPPSRSGPRLIQPLNHIQQRHQMQQRPTTSSTSYSGGYGFSSNNYSNYSTNDMQYLGSDGSVGSIGNSRGRGGYEGYVGASAPNGAVGSSDDGGGGIRRFASPPGSFRRLINNNNSYLSFSNENNVESDPHLYQESNSSLGDYSQSTGYYPRQLM